MQQKDQTALCKPRLGTLSFYGAVAMAILSVCMLSLVLILGIIPIPKTGVVCIYPFLCFIPFIFIVSLVLAGVVLFSSSYKDERNKAKYALLILVSMAVVIIVFLTVALLLNILREIISITLRFDVSHL